MAQMLLSVFFYLRKSNIFKGFMGISTEVVRAEFRQSSGTYQLRAGLRNDSSVLMFSVMFTLNLSDKLRFYTEMTANVIT